MQKEAISMSEDFTFLSEEELLQGIATVNGPRSRRSRSSSSHSGHSSHSKASSGKTSHQSGKNSSVKSSAKKTYGKASSARTPSEKAPTKSSSKAPSQYRHNQAPSGARKPAKKKTPTRWYQKLIQSLFRTVA